MVTLATALEIVEQLPREQQEQLVEILRDRQRERRSETMAQDVLTWEDLSQRIEAAGEDSDQPSLQEISEIVKEVRRSRRAKMK